MLYAIIDWVCLGIPKLCIVGYSLTCPIRFQIGWNKLHTLSEGMFLVCWFAFDGLEVKQPEQVFMVISRWYCRVVSVQVTCSSHLSGSIMLCFDLPTIYWIIIGPFCIKRLCMGKLARTETSLASQKEITTAQFQHGIRHQLIDGLFQSVYQTNGLLKDRS